MAAAIRNNDTQLTATRKYILENEYVMGLAIHKIPNHSKRYFNYDSISWLVKTKIKALIFGGGSYIKEVVRGWRWLIPLVQLKNSKINRHALVLGNGPSQGYLTSETVQEFITKGGEVFAVNFYNENKKLAEVPPKYLVLSDPASLDFEKVARCVALKKYLLDHVSVKIICPVSACNMMADHFGKKRLVGFIDSEIFGWGSNIMPIAPRGYFSMTLYKALAMACWYGYKKIYVLGMDNTYPRNTYCDNENRVLNLETHAGIDDFVADQSAFYRGMGDLMFDLSRIFLDARKFSKNTNIINLDPFSLTDAFPKAKTTDVSLTLNSYGD